MDALTLRNALKAKKPTFLRSDAHRVVRLEKKWHAPKGGDAKIRRKLRSYRRQPSIGWGSPRQARGLTPEGYTPVLVATENDLMKVKDACIIARTVGMKKQRILLQKCQEKKLKVLNVKSIEAALKKIEEKLSTRKEERKARFTKKEKTKEQAIKKVQEKEAKKEETPEEKEKREAEEKRKVLEHK